MALPASDSLAGPAGGQLITVYSANWTALVNNMNVFPNGTGGSASGNCVAYWNADAFPNDQYVQAAIGAIQNSQFSGICVRASATGTCSYYGFRVNINASQYQVIKYVSNTFTNISTTLTQTFLNGDILKLQVTGQSPNNVVTAYLNGAVLYTTTDSSAVNSGSAGVIGNSNVINTGPLMKNWTAGSAVSTFPGVLRRRSTGYLSPLHSFGRMVRAASGLLVPATA